MNNTAIQQFNNLLIISGPTACGKTVLALELAKEFNGELISADSRQVYKGMDIITGKDLGKISNIKYQISNKSDTAITPGYYELAGVKLWGVDLVEPDEEFDVNTFVTTAQTIIEDIESRGKLPIVVGGTYFYIKNLLQPASTISIPINPVLRQELNSLPVSSLQQRLQEVDQPKWQTMNNSDCNNSRRLVRAIEVGEWAKESRTKRQESSIDTKYGHIWLGLTADKETIKQRIEKRVDERIKAGAEGEVKRLVYQGFQWSLPSMSGIGYRDFRAFLEGKQTLEDTVKLWKLHEFQYAKRQMTFLRQRKEVEWINILDKNLTQEAKVLVQKWLNNS